LKTHAEIIVETSGISGLTLEEVADSRKKNGRNEIIDNKNHFLDILTDLLKEPMLILLIVASIIYFITCNTSDGFFMVSALVIVTGISLF